ncbi:MAG: type III secretion system chaperone [Actinomycetota bacterium]
MTDVLEVVERWLDDLPVGATAERVRENFWYVRLPGVSRSWIPIEIEVGEKSVKLTSHVIIEPEEREADVYKLLLRHNHKAAGVSFSLDGREGVICLVTRIPLGEIDQAKLDSAVGRIVEATETTFRSILEIGFGSRLRKR